MGRGPRSWRRSCTPNAGMVQMRVTPGPQNQAQRTQSVSPIGLVVNGLHCAASHTHTTSLRCHPHVPTLNHAELRMYHPPLAAIPAGLPISKPFLIPTSGRPAKLAAVEACKAMDLHLWTNQVLRKSS